MRSLFRLILVLLLGYYIMEWWLNQQKQQAVSPVSPIKTAPSASKSATSSSTPSPASSESDPLVELDGIGPAYERALNALGIRTFAQLAAQDPDELAVRLSSVRVTAARIKRDHWIEQAAARANSPVSTSSRWSANDGNSA